MNITILFWRGRLGGCFALVVVLLALLTPSSADGQWLEETIYLPDAFGGVIYPNCIAFDTVRNKVYFGGGDIHPNDDGGSDDATLDYWVVVVDAASMRRVAHVQVPGRVSGLCFNPANNRMYCALSWVDTVAVIDCTTDSLVALIPVGRNPDSLCCNPDDNKVYCLNRWSDDLSVIDGSTDTVLATLTPPGTPLHMAYSGANRTLYCADELGNVVLIDGQGDSIRAIVDLDTSNHRTASACWNPQENKYYCLTRHDGLYVLYGRGDSLLTQVPLGPVLSSVCYNPADNRVYCVGAHDSIWVIDCTADTVEDIIALPEYDCGQITCSPRSGRLYCLPPVDEVSGLKKVMVVDCVGDSFVKFLPTGWQPIIMGYDALQDRLYTLDLEVDQATVLDCGGDSVVGTVGLGFRPLCLAYASNENKVYVGGESFERVIAIDAATNRVVAEIPAGYWVWNMCYNPVVSKLYCAAAAGDSVTIIDCTTDSVVARLALVDEPGSFVFSPVGGSKVYCRRGYGLVAAIDGVRDSIVKVLNNSGPPRVTNSQGDKVYCGNFIGGVRVIDCHGDTLLPSCNTTGRPNVYNTVDNKLYVSMDSILIVDGLGDTVIASTDTADRTGNWGPACFVDRHDKVYIADNYWSAPPVLLVLDGATDSVLGLYDMYESPAHAVSIGAMYYNPVNDKVYFTTGVAVGIIDPANDSVIRVIDDVECGAGMMAWNPLQNRTYVLCTDNGCISVIRDSVVPGVSENPPSRQVSGKPGPTIARAVLHMPKTGMTKAPYAMTLLDISGRRVLDLHPGENGISHLSPGVYFWKDRRTDQTGRVVVVK